MEGVSSIESFNERRIVCDRYTSIKFVYEYKPLIKSGNDLKLSNLWFTKEELSRWPSESASVARRKIEEFHEKEDSRVIYAKIEDGAKSDAKRELVLMPMSIISRECTSASRKYQVTWTDESIISTLHTSTEMHSWTYRGDEVGIKLIESFDSNANDVIRVYLNSRNRYGKSAFISMCEFGKLDILKLVLNACDGQWALQVDSKAI